MLALELAGRAEKHELSQWQLSQANNLIQENRSKVNVFIKQASAKEELIAGFHKSPTLLESLAGVMVELLDVGHRFSIQKHGLEDSDGVAELNELITSFAGLAAALRVDESLSAEHPWWIPVLEKAILAFISTTWDDPCLPACTDQLYPLFPFPEELLAFFETETKSFSKHSLLLRGSISSSSPATSSQTFLLDEPIEDVPRRVCYLFLNTSRSLSSSHDFRYCHSHC